MPYNIIDAIIRIVEDPIINLQEYNNSHNRMNSMGEALEEYIKDLFAGTLNVNDHQERNLLLNEQFSYLGNQNNPPDAIIRNGDALEVKKLEGVMSSIALNSSYPKAKLYSNSPMITEACKNCENWTEKDIIYAIGTVLNKKKLTDLRLIYGEDYAASDSIYKRIKEAISNGVNDISDIEFSDTKELGRVNRVDPLGITYLRIRGMWGIENPYKVYEYIYTRDKCRPFNFMALINKRKYHSFNNIDTLEKLETEKRNLVISDVKIKQPDNPANLIEAKLITFKL